MEEPGKCRRRKNNYSSFCTAKEYDNASGFSAGIICILLKFSQRNKYKSKIPENSLAPQDSEMM